MRCLTRTFKEMSCPPIYAVPSPALLGQLLNDLIWCLNTQPFRAFAVGLLFNGRIFAIMRATREKNERGLVISVSKMLEIESNVNIIASILTADPTAFGHCGPREAEEFLGEGMTSFVFTVNNGSGPQVLKVFKRTFLEEGYTIDGKHIKDNEIEALSLHLPRAASGAQWQLTLQDTTIIKVAFNASSLPPRQELLNVDDNSIYTRPVCRAIHRSTFQEGIALLDVALDVMNVLCMLHQAGFVHSDISRHNIMLFENRAVIIDYGLVRKIDGRKGLVCRDLMKFCATIMYWFTGGQVLRSKDLPQTSEECQANIPKDWVGAFTAALGENQQTVMQEVLCIIKGRGASLPPQPNSPEESSSQAGMLKAKKSKLHSIPEVEEDLPRESHHPFPT